MKKKYLIVVAVSLGRIGIVFGAQPATPAPGKKIYDSKCASCHGKDAKGNAAMAKMFKVASADLNLVDEGTAKKLDEELLKIITEGKNKMPAYSKQLKAEEQKSVLQYIRGLAPKKAESKPEEKAATEKVPAPATGEKKK